MKPFSRKKEPKVIPLQELEVDRKHLTLRIVFFAVFLAIGIVCLILAITGFFSSPQPDGWQSVTVQTDGASCADEFSLIYDLGKGELSAKDEYARISELYAQACVKAYRLYHAEQTFEGERGLADLNAHPGQPISLDPALVKSLKLADSAGRELYLGPIYPYYRLICSSKDDVQADEFDPRENPQIAAFFGEIAEFARDPESVRLEFSGENEVCLRISEKYADFAKAHDIYTFVDFGWMKNAFIADDLADTLISAGYTRGALSSYDGFTRNLDARDTPYALYLYGRKENTVYTAATLNYSGVCSIVSLRNLPVNASDGSHYYVRSDGRVISPYIDVRDALCRAAADHLIARSESLSCGELLMKLLPAYIGDRFDPSPLSGGEISAICCQNGEILRQGDGFALSDVQEGYEIKKMDDL